MSVNGSVSSSPAHAECLHKKKEVSSQLEKKMDDGLDRALTSLVGWIKHILSNEQKKSDFKPDETASLNAVSTPACHHTCRFLETQRQVVVGCLDGKNRVATLIELGMRFHRVLVDHVQQFGFNSVGECSVPVTYWYCCELGHCCRRYVGYL